jgi:hypothetical protein
MQRILHGMHQTQKNEIDPLTWLAGARGFEKIEKLAQGE